METERHRLRIRENNNPGRSAPLIGYLLQFLPALFRPIERNMLKGTIPVDQVEDGNAVGHSDIQ